MPWGNGAGSPNGKAKEVAPTISMKQLLMKVEKQDQTINNLLKKNANKNHAGGNPKRNEHKDRDKRKLATATKHEASGFSNW